MNETEINQSLIGFLNSSPSPFHAVHGMQCLLNAAGFSELLEEERWQLEPGCSYYVIRGGAAIIAFRLSFEPVDETGIAMVGAHTDSPALKIKPVPELDKNGYRQLGVEVYGGALLNSWFDRDLSLAGRVSYLDQNARLCSELIDFRRAVAVIPSLAIHLDRKANSNRSINAQTDIVPILGITGEHGRWDLRAQLAVELETIGCEVDKVLDFDLHCYDTQPAALIGLDEEFIASARLDNLLSCYVGLQALLASDPARTALLVCTDHEEVGSASHTGAHGTFLDAVLGRLAADPEAKTRAMSQSMMISVDNAHGVHPNFADKHDANHGPLLNKGPVIKMNASQRYASSSVTSGLFRHLCDQMSVPVQTFVVRSDMACGSTIGPIAAAQLGVNTLDVGVPTFAMHSVRELAGAKDPFFLYRALVGFFERRND